MIGLSDIEMKLSIKCIASFMMLSSKHHLIARVHHRAICVDCWRGGWSTLENRF